MVADRVKNKQLDIVIPDSVTKEDIHDLKFKKRGNQIVFMGREFLCEEGSVYIGDEKDEQGMYDFSYPVDKLKKIELKKEIKLDEFASESKVLTLKVTYINKQGKQVEDKKVLYSVYKYQPTP